MKEKLVIEIFILHYLTIYIQFMMEMREFEGDYLLAVVSVVRLLNVKQRNYMIRYDTNKSYDTNKLYDTGQFCFLFCA